MESVTANMPGLRAKGIANAWDDGPVRIGTRVAGVVEALRSRSERAPKSRELHVLSLNYCSDLLRTDGTPTSDTVNRLHFYAQHVDSYTILVMTRRSEGYAARTLGNMRVIPTNGRNFLHAFWRMYRLGRDQCREGKINVIQAQEPCQTGVVGQILKSRFGLPTSVCVFGPNPFDEHWRRASLYNRIMAPLARYVLRRADGIVTDGKLTVNRLQRAGIPHESTTWKPNVPSNICEFENADAGELRDQLLDDRFDHLLLSVGTMSVQKNVPFVLKTFRRVLARVPRTRLVMVGRGRRKEKYKEMARRLGLEANILWLDSVPHTEISAYFKACDVFVFGSRFEGFPRVFMEAAAAALAIVTTEVSGCTDGLIPDESGFMLPQGDEVGFADRVLELLNNPEKAKAMGQRGRALVRGLSSERSRFNLRQVAMWRYVKARSIRRAPFEADNELIDQPILEASPS